MTQIIVKLPKDYDDDNPGILLDTRMDANGNTLREADGRVHLYER